MQKYKWLDIKTETDLKKEYKFKELCSIILSDLGLQGVIKIRNFSNLFKLIKALDYFRKESNDFRDEFFISEEHKIAFMLLNYNKQFNNTLCITQRHYVDKNKAKEWRNKYIKMFHTDNGIKFANQEEIVNSINTIYKRMVGEA